MAPIWTTEAVANLLVLIDRNLDQSHSWSHDLEVLLNAAQSDKFRSITQITTLFNKLDKGYGWNSRLNGRSLVEEGLGLDTQGSAALMDLTNDQMNAIVMARAKFDSANNSEFEDASENVGPNVAVERPSSPAVEFSRQGRKRERIDREEFESGPIKSVKHTSIATPRSTRSTAKKTSTTPCSDPIETRRDPKQIPNVKKPSTGENSKPTATDRQFLDAFYEEMLDRIAAKSSDREIDFHEQIESLQEDLRLTRARIAELEGQSPVAVPAITPVRITAGDTSLLDSSVVNRLDHLKRPTLRPRTPSPSCSPLKKHPALARVMETTSSSCDAFVECFNSPTMDLNSPSVTQSTPSMAIRRPDTPSTVASRRPHVPFANRYQFKRSVNSFTPSSGSLRRLRSATDQDEMMQDTSEQAGSEVDDTREEVKGMAETSQFFDMENVGPRYQSPTEQNVYLGCDAVGKIGCITEPNQS